MLNKSAKIAVPSATVAPGVDDPRRTFESAIAHLQAGRSCSQTPIALRSRKTIVGDPGAEKRVLNDAARALARLWNVSTALIR
ncbi:MAG TPA: hypothetical protein VMH04_03735 [Candidatus Solibacter sp.]|nr:hypothetical protein [Candidatus Solibacter sp.]